MNRSLDKAVADVRADSVHMGLGNLPEGYIGNDVIVQDSNNNNEVYRLGSVYFNAVNDTPEVELVNRKEYKQQLLSPLTQPNKQFPIGLVNQDTVTIYPKVTSSNSGYYSILDPFVQRSQYISIKFPLHSLKILESLRY